MSACWVCRAAIALLVAASFTGEPAAAAGKVTVTTDDGTVRKIEVHREGIVVTRTSSDSDSVVDVGDSFGAGSFKAYGPNGGRGIVRLFSDAEVGPGERVDGDVVAVFGSLRIEGEVTGSAVAVLGSVDLRPGARVRGDAVAVGGSLREEEGARVEGQTVQVGFMPFTLGLPGLPMVLFTIVLAWLVSVFFGWVTGLLFPGRLARVAITSSRRTAASLALGIASGPLLLMSMLILMVTVVGFPIALILPFVYVGVLYLGQLAATYVLGCKLTRRRLGEGGVTAPLVAGTLLVASIFSFGAILWETPGVVRTAALFFLAVGVLLLLGLATIGTGAFLLSRAGSRPRDLHEPGPEGATANASASGATVTP